MEDNKPYMDRATIQRILEYEDNQELIRQRFIKAFRSMHRPSLAKIAVEMGVSPTTINYFFKGVRRVEYRVLYDIQMWVEQKESELAAK